jgi:hypothetical protein
MRDFTNSRDNHGDFTKIRPGEISKTLDLSHNDAAAAMRLSSWEFKMIGDVSQGVPSFSRLGYP